MSTEDKLTFQCPACQSTLKVPSHMAGIQGPCPQCGTEIVAPNPALQSAACLVSSLQLAGATAGYGSVEPSYAPPTTYAAPSPPPNEPYNSWETPETGAHGELNLGAALAQPVPAPPVAPQPAPMQGAAFPPAEQLFAAPPAQEAPPLWVPQPQAEQAPTLPPAPNAFAAPPAEQASAYPPQAPNGANENPFAHPSPGFGVPQPAPEQAAFAPTAPPLFPVGAGNAAAPAGRTSEARKGARTKRRRNDRERGSQQGLGRSGVILLAVGVTAALGAAAFFLVPGLKDKILGRSKPLDVTVETAIPVPPRPVPGASLPDPAAPADDSPTAQAPVPVPAPEPSPKAATPPMNAATAKPAPDFGLGDPPSPPEESAPPRAMPAQPVEETPPPPPVEKAAPPQAEVKSNTEAFQGDSTASPEDVAAARIILENFINAHTIEERLAYCQPAPKIEEQMRNYYAKHPTAPKPVQINYTLANILEGSTKRFFIFEVTTDQQQQGFPVAVEETDNGMKVDWRSFVEFHDNMLGNFFKVYRTGTEQFRVILERAHYFKSDVPDLGSKLAFRIKPPIPGFEGYAFCPKDTSIGAELDRKFAWDVKYLPIVELEWTKDEKGAKFIKILRVVQDNWRALQ